MGTIFDVHNNNNNNNNHNNNTNAAIVLNTTTTTNNNNNITQLNFNTTTTMLNTTTTPNTALLPDLEPTRPDVEIFHILNLPPHNSTPSIIRYVNKKTQYAI
eukprot:UN01890